MAKGRISNEEKRKREESEFINKFGFVPIGINAGKKVQEFTTQIKKLKVQIENCENEIQAMNKELLEEKKAELIKLLQELPSDTIDEVVNCAKEQKSVVEPESNI